MSSERLISRRRRSEGDGDGEAEQHLAQRHPGVVGQQGAAVPERR